MASFQITVIGAAGGSFGNLTGAFEISDDDSDRILWCAAQKFPTLPDGSPASPVESAQMLMREVFDRLLAIVSEHEKFEAYKNAGAPIPYTPLL